jgi:hypothetical protein
MKPTYLFIDDERFPPDGKDWAIVRSVEEGLDWVRKNGCPSFVSFDNDLGDGMPEGRQFAAALVDMDVEANGQFMPSDFAWYAHTQNPVARDAINGLLENWMTFKRKNFGQEFLPTP